MPWDTLRDLRAWQERLERLTAPRADSWAPPIDVYEAPDRYVIAAEVPGLGRDEVDIGIEDTRVTLRGQRLERSAAGGEIVHYHQIERGYGAFARTFEFGEKIDAAQVKADLRNGVLTIILPKAPSVPPRKVAIEVE